MPKASPLENMPLPTAALVIDTRSTTIVGNYILKTLKDEIDTLCQEMHMEQINQWRYLTSILDYLPVGTLSQSELQNYHASHTPQSGAASEATSSTPTSAPSASKTGQYTPTVMGQVDTQTLRHHTFFRGNPQRHSLDDISEGNFKDNLRHILSLCDTLRTKRVNATIDLGTQGNLGRTRPEDGMVRVIFIADAQSEASLATAATYAAYLRKETLFQNAYEQQLLLSTMIICQNHENRGEAPKMLIDALSWDNNDSWPHIDSCILVESYSEHGARLTDETQEEYIEFLLYILIITDPYQLRIEVPSPDEEQLEEQLHLEKSAKWRMLPSEKCFSIGLSAFTYSVRWGHYLLNSSLTQHIVQELTDHSEALSTASTRVMVNKWLDEQCATLQSAIPKQVVGDMPELNALMRAEAIAKPASEIFPPHRVSLHTGNRSLATLDQYADELETIYNTSTPQQASLQDAMQQEPIIHDYVSRWKGDADSPLMTVLTNACHVLVDQPFFDKTNARGTVLRAKHQLQEIAAVIAERQNKHQGDAIQPSKQREDLHCKYEAERQALETLNRQSPLLRRRFKGMMVVLTVLLLLFIALGLIFRLSVLSYISVLIAIVTLVVVLIKVSYFSKWHRNIEQERVRIVNTLRDQHLQAVSKVRQYLAETFLLALLQRADLVDETGTNPGCYYTAIEQLHTLLNIVQEQTEKRYQMIQQHLERITENQTKGPASSKLYLREELLDLTALNNRLAILQADIDANPLLVEFVELLLRELGVETPNMIFRDIEQRPLPAKTLFREDGYQYEAQIFLSMLTAQALELSLEQPSSTPPDVEMLERQYKGLDYHYQHVLMRNLIEQMKVKLASRVSTKKSQAEPDGELAMGALTAWVQLLWEQDEPLQTLLIQEGVLAHMERKNYSQQTMRIKFIIRTAPVNRPMHIGQQTDTYLIAFPPDRGTKLLRELDIARIFVDFPDEELLALLSLSHYVAMPYKVEEVKEPSPRQLGAEHSNSTDSAANGQLPLGNNVSATTPQDTWSGVQSATPTTDKGVVA